MLFDSEFLIAASGQRGARRQAAAEVFLHAHLDVPLYTSRVCWAEYAEGCASLHEANHGTVRFTVIEIDQAVAWQCARISRHLVRRGLHIGDNDIWIAATALAHGLPLVTRNARHFGRIAGLALEIY
jgi:predicted nucleic acid-binding protein